MLGFALKCSLCFCCYPICRIRTPGLHSETLEDGSTSDRTEYHGGSSRSGGPGRCPRICNLDLCDWRVQWLWNRALTRCLAGTDYGMPKIVSADLVWIPDSVHGARLPDGMIVFGFGVEGALMCLDSVSLLSCIQTPNIGSNCHVLQMTREGKQCGKLLGYFAWSFVIGTCCV
ncbi:hypothetical protein M9H77_29628 [Catharanthus roseus]|uniref:Uncharacterized protein n=1 Tax=Catharanthus roseus TaxID=4058 RepID=A0ACB9ZYU3_CATRO|nr:hypothetical protein M9H77_29628 [Catharanthus roseus]